MADTDQDTYALAWRNPDTGKWYYIPTQPEARLWRGPYHSAEHMERLLHKELGEHATVITTTVEPKLKGG